MSLQHVRHLEQIEAGTLAIASTTLHTLFLGLGHKVHQNGSSIFFHWFLSVCVCACIFFILFLLYYFVSMLLHYGITFFSSALHLKVLCSVVRSRNIRVFLSFFPQLCSQVILSQPYPSQSNQLSWRFKFYFIA